MKTKTILIIIVGIMRVLRVIYKVRRSLLIKKFNNTTDLKEKLMYAKKLKNLE